jgi:hypothetical protein
MFTPKRKTSQVFGVSNVVLPNSYVDRGSLDEQIQTLLQRTTHIALRGESKCGKSWLRQKNIKDGITVQCRLDRGAHDLYIDALSQLGISFVLDNTSSGKISGKVNAHAEIGEGLLAKALGASAGVKGEAGGEYAKNTRTQPAGHDVSDLRFIADLIRESGRRLIIEDFHYLSVDERKKFAFDLKALWDYGVFVVIIGVWSQSNMLIYLNPDLTGRINEIPIYWSAEDLQAVLSKGGEALNLEFTEGFIRRIIKDCYGNVGILQTLILKALDAAGICESADERAVVNNFEALETASLQYAEQLNPLYQHFAKGVSSGIRIRSDSTGIYAHAMAVILDASDEDAIRGLSLDYIFQQARFREPRIQKGNLRVVLEHFEQLQIDEHGRGLVLAYNEATGEVSVVDRQLLLYRKYSTVKWLWEDLIAEAHDQSDA